jgi:xanthine/uracil permease
MGVIAKFGAVFASMPPSVLGGMQVFLYSTIAVAGVRVLALIEWTRRDRFILTVALGIGFMDICQPDWFSSMLTYNGPNQSLVGLEQGVNLAVETPFVISAIIGVLLNSLLPGDRTAGLSDGYGDENRHPVIGQHRD